MEKETPKYKHDCNICRFLGRYQDTDLYEHLGIQNTLIARFSDDGPDYESGLATAKYCLENNPTHPLAEAYRRSSFNKKEIEE